MEEKEFELSPKQMQFLYESDDLPINLSEGAVRSGKTYAQYYRWLEFVATHDGPFLMTGKTHSSIRRNVLDPMQQLFGKARIQFTTSQLEAHIAGKTCYVVSAKDAASEYVLRGMTVQGWLADEITLHPEDFTNQAITRCSLADAKMFWSCNPDSPAHYIKRRFMENNANVRWWHWKLSDNPYISDKYIDILRTSYSGLWARRFINGEWCISEGAVYDQWDPKRHTFNVGCSPLCDKYYVGVDYGTHNPTVFLLIGERNESGKHRVYVLKEYYYDSTITLKQKTDEEYVEDFIHFVGGLSLSGIAVDPSAASFITALRKKKFIVTLADNAVIDGIRSVSMRLSNGTLFVSKRCKKTIEELGIYVWDKRASERGEDKPEKTNDHAPDALRYCIKTFIDREGWTPKSGGKRVAPTVDYY